MKEAFTEWLVSLKPRIHMIIRFKSDYAGMPREQARWHLNWLLHCINRRLFNRHYRQNNTHLQGFVFREKPEDYVHFHLLLMLDSGLFSKFCEALNLALPRIHLPGTSMQVLEEPTIKLISHYSNEAVMYCLKDVRQHMGILNLDDIAILDRYGMPALVNDFETILRGKRNYVFK